MTTEWEAEFERVKVLFEQFLRENNLKLDYYDAGEDHWADLECENVAIGMEDLYKALPDDLKS